MGHCDSGGPNFVPCFMGLAQFILLAVAGYDHNWVLFCNIDRIANWGLSGQCGPNHQKKVPNRNCRNRDFFSASLPHPHHRQVFPREIGLRCGTVYRVFDSRSTLFFRHSTFLTVFVDLSASTHLSIHHSIASQSVASSGIPEFRPSDEACVHSQSGGDALRLPVASSAAVLPREPRVPVADLHAAVPVVLAVPRNQRIPVLRASERWKRGDL